MMDNGESPSLGAPRRLRFITEASNPDKTILAGEYHSALIDGGRTSRKVLRSCLPQRLPTSHSWVPGMRPPNGRLARSHV